MNFKNLLQLDSKNLRTLKVSEKFSYTFRRIKIYLILAIVMLGATIGVSIYGLNTIYHDKTQQVYYQGLLRIHNQNLGKSMWYSIATDDEAVRAEMIEEFSVTMISTTIFTICSLKLFIISKIN